MRLVRPTVSVILPAVLLATSAIGAPGCVAPTTGARGIALDDPLGLVQDVASTGHPLRVYVLPASSYTCDVTVGTINPDIPDLEAGMVPDAVVDIEADISGDMATAMAQIPSGDWTVLVRGKGTDAVSHVPNVIIATGCATVSGLAASETRQVNITLLSVHANGVCNDGVLSPDEQCESTSPDCDGSCHTTPVAVNTRVMGGQSGARATSATGQRVAITFGSMGTDVGIRMLDPDGRPITTPATLSRDETVDTLAMPIPQAQTSGRPAMASDGHFAIALTSFNTPGGDPSDVVVQFFSADRAPMATTNVLTTTAGGQSAPDAAYAGNGALMVVYEDTASATGISGTVFAAGSTTAGASFAVGTGVSGGSHPRVAGLASGFVVAFGALDGDVRYQRFGADGTPTDAAPVAVLDAASATDTQDEPAVGANSDGSFLVAWTEHSIANGDGMGTSIRARAFAASGSPAGMPLVLPTTGAAGDQSAPTVAAADARYVVAWASSGSVHARCVSSSGSALPNREQPQSTNDFVVAAAGNAPSATAMGTTIPSWLIAYDASNNVFARRYPR